jgi:hypothetical protein
MTIDFYDMNADRPVLLSEGALWLPTLTPSTFQTYCHVAHKRHNAMKGWLTDWLTDHQLQSNLGLSLIEVPDHLQTVIWEIIIVAAAVTDPFHRSACM